jgi:hypothetical protein
LIGTRLQERLNRRLQEAEVQRLAEIIRAFVARTLTEDRIEEIGARVYASQFDEAELKALVEFQHPAPFALLPAGRPRAGRGRPGRTLSTTPKSSRRTAKLFFLLSGRPTRYLAPADIADLDAHFPN